MSHNKMLFLIHLTLVDASLVCPLQQQYLLSTKCQWFVCYLIFNLMAMNFCALIFGRRCCCLLCFLNSVANPNILLIYPSSGFPLQLFAHHHNHIADQNVVMKITSFEVVIKLELGNLVMDGRILEIF